MEPKTVVFIIIILIFVWYIWFYSGLIEHYGVCKDCDLVSMPRNGILVLNPYIWPYSGAPCINDLYKMNKQHPIEFGYDNEAPYHLQAADHVALM